MTLKKIDRNVCKLIRDKAPAHLTTFCEDHGLNVDFKNATYDPDKGTVEFKVEFSLDGVDPRKVEFERSCYLFDIKPEQYEAEFTNNGDKFKLVGFKTRSPKFPVIGQRISDGKSYKFTEKVLVKIRERAAA